MTHLDSMTARHSAGEQLTHTEQGELLEALRDLVNGIGMKEASSQWHKAELAWDKLTAPAPAPQPDMVSDCCKAPAQRQCYVEGGWDDSCTKCGGICFVEQAPQQEQKVCEWRWQSQPDEPGSLIKTSCRRFRQDLPNNGICACGLPIREVGGEAR